jgi:hypothetical protein
MDYNKEVAIFGTLAGDVETKSRCWGMKNVNLDPSQTMLT